MNAAFVRQILIITLFRLLLNTGRRFIYPFAPALSRGLDVPLGAITTIIAAGQFTSLLGIFAGPLADRYGCRLMMRAGLAMLAVGMLICGLVPLYWPVFVGLVVSSFGKTLFDPAIQAYIGNNVRYERRGRILPDGQCILVGPSLVQRSVMLPRAFVPDGAAQNSCAFWVQHRVGRVELGLEIRCALWVIN